MFSSDRTSHTDQISPDSTEAAPDLRELDLLAHVHQAHQDRRHPTQRTLARALGLSLGMTNAILKRLVGKGFLMVRRINSANVHYLVTPDGLDQLSRRSYLYLRRTVGHVVRYKERVREFCRGQAEAGTREIVLVGKSDLEFLLEWCAEKEGMRFRVVEVDEISGSSATVLWVISERAGAEEAEPVQSNPDRVVRLADLIAPPVGDVISDDSVRGDLREEE